MQEMIAFAPYLLERKANQIRQSMDHEKAQKYKCVQSVYDGQTGRSYVMRPDLLHAYAEIAFFHLDGKKYLGGL